MEDEKATLNYECNYNLFLAKRLISDMKRVRDRENAIKWLRFLMNSNRSIAEMQLRNDFMYYLLLNLQEGCLRPPFENPPPTVEELTDVSDLIPGKIDHTEDFEDAMGMDETGQERAFVMSKSPDNGAFLAAQPVPHHGSFCYLAITTRRKNG